MVGGEIDLRDAFQESLNSAIAQGLRPSRWIGLGDKTFTAIEAIAQEHPDATVDHISGAYDAFAHEHGPAPVKPPPNRLEVQRRFKRS
jgi:basic membrane lipoprotein Med (substrate-binding protein (PBP1-ABC) superfamily)